MASLVGLVAAEGGYRLWLSVTDRAWNLDRLESELGEVRDQMAGERAWELAGMDTAEEAEATDGPSWVVSPYVGFDLSNSVQYIDRHLKAQAEGDDFTILILGGSVAANFSFLGRERLLQELAKDARLAGREIRVLNYARAAHKAPQQLTHAAYLFSLGLAPDVVLCLDGFNELAVAARNAKQGTHPALPSVGQWLPLLTDSAGDSAQLERLAAVLLQRNRALAEIDAWLASATRHSAMIGRRGLVRIDRARVAYAKAVEEVVASEGASARDEIRGPSFAGGPSEVLEECARIWSETSISLNALCEARGITYLHVLQPTLHDADSKPLTEEERRTGKAPEVWERAARDGYPLLRAAGMGLRERGIAFHDGSRAFATLEDTVYYDACHFRKPGHEVLALDVARALAESLPD